MKRLSRRIIVSVVFATFFPLLVAAAGLDDYYRARFDALYGGHKRVALALPASDRTSEERCLTPFYHAFKRDYKNLTADTQQALAKYLTKPVLSGQEATFISDQAHFQIHYATSGPDAVPPADANANGIPDWVERVASVFEFVYSSETGHGTGEMGYAPAPTLSGKPYDIYLQEISQTSEYGFTETEGPPASGSNSATSFIVIDNDFANPIYAPYTGLQGLQLAASHEYHHAIQYGYNYFFDVWFGEATATWIEDEVYDSINQLYNYAPAYLRNSTLSLDTPISISTGGGYGRWLFNRHLAELYGGTIIRAIWERTATQSSPDGNGDIPMLPVIDDVLKRSGGSLATDFFSFTKKLYTRNWTTHTNDASNIHPIVPVAAYLNFPVTGATSPAPSITLPHDAFAYVTLIPSMSAPRDLVLTLLKSNGIAAVAFKKLAGGAITEHQFDGNAKTITIAGFNAADTVEVALLIANTGTQDTLTANFSTDPASPPPPVTSDNGGGSGGGCFIATAAYGSYLHPKVVILRQFRDRYLLTNAPGRALTALYYRLSPPLADLIARHAGLRLLCRTILAPLILAAEHRMLATLILLGALVCLFHAFLIPRLRKKFLLTLP